MNNSTQMLIKVSNNVALTWHSILIVSDIIAVLFFVTRPPVDKVHGGLGQGLMALYGLGIIFLLLVYEGVFLALYFKSYFKFAKVMWWILLSIHLYLLLVVTVTSLS